MHLGLLLIHYFRLHHHFLQITNTILLKMLLIIINLIWYLMKIGMALK